MEHEKIGQVTDEVKKFLILFLKLVISKLTKKV